jgi:hypothetical protein
MKNMEALRYSEDHITVDTFGTLHIRGRQYSRSKDHSATPRTTSLSTPSAHSISKVGSRSKDLELLRYSEDHITVDTFGTLHIRGRQ